MAEKRNGRRAIVESGYPLPSPGWTLFALVGLSFASLLANLYLIGIPNPSDQVKTLIDTFSLTWKGGVSAVAVILIGRGVFRHWPMGQ